MSSFQILSVCASFASIFVVVPFLISDPESYAIYAFSLSLCFFLTYGDFGFCRAAQKYCAEEFGRGCLDKELEYAGFLVAILGAISLSFAGLMSIAVYSPELLLPQLSPINSNLASSLFLILAIFMPIQVLLQRFVTLIMSSRLKEYYALRHDLVANILKIAIVPLFDSSDGFLLEYYFMTTILLSIISASVSVWVIKFVLDFPVMSILKYVRFSHNAYAKMGSLASSTFFGTLLFILVYELDLIILSRFYSLEAVGAYAIAFTLVNFIRRLSSIIYSPLISLMNRFYGQGEKELVKKGFDLILKLSVPLFMVLIMVLFTGADQLIFLWLGVSKPLTLEIYQIMLIGLFFVGATNLSGILTTTLVLNRDIYLLGLIPVILCFSTFFLLQVLLPELGVTSLAYSKAFATLGTSVFALFLFLRESVINFLTVIKFVLLTGICAVIPVVLNTFAFNFTAGWEAGIINLVVFAFWMGLLIFGLWFLSVQIFGSVRVLIRSFVQNCWSYFKKRFSN